MLGILNFPRSDFLQKGLVASALTNEGSSGKPGDHEGFPGSVLVTQSSPTL